MCVCVFVLFKTTCNFMASLRLKQEITNQYVRVLWTTQNSGLPRNFVWGGGFFNQFS